MNYLILGEPNSGKSRLANELGYKLSHNPVILNMDSQNTKFEIFDDKIKRNILQTSYICDG